MTDPLDPTPPSEHAPEVGGAASPPLGEPGEGPPTVRDVEYKGEPLDAERGPGLGCFWAQLIVLAILVVLTPLSALVFHWPDAVSAALLFATILLLLIAGQTIIFLLRLVAADRRAAGRRRPLASSTRTVGELEDEVEAGRVATERAADAPDADGGHDD